MRYHSRRQKEKEFQGVRVNYPAACHWWLSTGQVLDLSALMLLKAKIIQAFLGVIFLLLMTLILIVLRDRGSVIQVGLHLPVWPQTIHNLLSPTDLNHSNVYSEEEGVRAKRRENVKSLTSFLKPGNYPVSHQDQAMNLEAGTEPGDFKKADSSPYPEDYATTTSNSSSHSVLQEDTASNASSVPVVRQDHSREFQFTAQEEGWLQFPHLVTDETEQLALQIQQNGTLPCHNVRTQSAQILGLPEPSKRKGHKAPVIRLEAGPVHEFTITSMGDDGQPRCAGGDYYETDLSGPLWKSRPPVMDYNNGTYSVRLQMDPRFASGVYTFKVILLFTNFHALHFHPQRWARMEEVGSYQIEFVGHESAEISEPSAGPRSAESPTANSSVSSNELSTTSPVAPELHMCSPEDFKKKYWSGRWTRESATKDCEYDRLGRWKCVDLNLKCQKPWCQGPVGSLESNGWVYSAHCAFKIFEQEEAWKCLDRKWLFFWGDSNHVDTIRNLLNFVLGFEQKIKFLDRRMDTTFLSPPNNRSSVRITSMFNGHSNVTLNYEGLKSLHDPGYAEQLRFFFMGETTPDFMIMNSGLHDGLYWRYVDKYMRDGVDYAANFWSSVWSGMKGRRPDVLYRTTVSTGGASRNLSFNPHKMELFNHLMVDKFLSMGLERFQVLDGFDYTYPWHFDHKTNDGVHYGRPPSKSRWAGGNVGHRYFVDLMLVHMLLNAICPQHDNQ